MVLTISEQDLQRMRGVLLDQDRDEALRLVRDLLRRLEIQANQGLKSHLDGG